MVPYMLTPREVTDLVDVENCTRLIAAYCRRITADMNLPRHDGGRQKLDLLGHPERTVFKRFVPVDRPGEGRGMWAHYYRRWASVTLANIDPALVELMPSLAAFTPPAKLLDKRVYSPWTEGKLDALLNGSGIDTLIITGGETDVCVLATVLGAVDRGFRVVLVTNAIYSSADQTHDALMEVYHSRFTEQIEAVTMQETLESWR